MFVTGRSRAEDAQYVLMTEDADKAQREQMNQIRENMMNKAIESINKMEDYQYQQKLHEFQMEALREKQSTMEANRRMEEMKNAARQNARDYQLRCMKCNSFAAISTDFRQIKESHHVIVDPDFFNRVIIEPHPKPIAIADDFVKSGKVFCKKCKYDWGIKAMYKNVGFPVLKISSFVLVDFRDNRDTCRKWKNAPFSVLRISPDDLHAQFQHQMEQQD